MTKAKDKIKEISAILSGAGIDSTSQESEMIVCEVLGIDAACLYRDDPGISDAGIEKADAMAERRIGREPIQYILGHLEFFDLRISVGEGVLIPRPETELLVEHTVKLLADGPPYPAILDLCTGSGCIALALAKKFPASIVYGTDTSEAAIGFAISNAAENGIENVKFLRGDLYSPMPSGTRFDLVISNPPYIKSADISGLQPEVREWEPVAALDGGLDGVDYYRVIIPGARKFLADNGILALEIAPEVASAASEIATGSGFIDVTVLKDYSGLERILTARWTR